MDSYSVVISNKPGDNPCDFYVRLEPPINTLEGEWWIGVISLTYDYTTRGSAETLYITTDIVKPVAFTNSVKKILTSMDGEVKSINYYEQEVVYIKMETGYHQFIHIEIIDQNSQPVHSTAFNGITRILATIKGYIPPPQEEDEDGNLKLEWLD